MQLQHVVTKLGEWHEVIVDDGEGGRHRVLERSIGPNTVERISPEGWVRRYNVAGRPKGLGTWQYPNVPPHYTPMLKKPLPPLKTKPKVIGPIGPLPQLPSSPVGLRPLPVQNQVKKGKAW